MGMLFGFIISLIIEFLTKVNEKLKKKLNDIMILNDKERIIRRQ